MAREKTKEYVAFNCKLDKQASDKLDTICKETGLSKTAAVERAIAILSNSKRQGGCEHV